MSDISGKGAEKYYYRKRAVRIYALAASLLLAVMQSVAFALGFEPVKRLYAVGNGFGKIAFYLTLLLVAVAYALPFIAVPKETVEESALPEGDRYGRYYTLDNTFTRVLRYCVAVTLVMQGVIDLVAVLSGAEAVTLPKGMAVLSFVFAFALAAYFVPELTEKLGVGEGKIHAVCGCIGLLWFVMNVLEHYYNKKISLASEFVTLTQLACLAMMLAVVYEMRYHFDGTKLRARLATSSAASVLGIGLGIGQLVMLMTSGQVSFGTTALGVSLLAIGLYFGARLFFYEED